MKKEYSIFVDRKNDAVLGLTVMVDDLPEGETILIPKARVEKLIGAGKTLYELAKQCDFTHDEDLVAWTAALKELGEA